MAQKNQVTPDDAVQAEESPANEGQAAAFERLGLCAEAIAAVRRQGCITREQRGRTTIFKLRYRMSGKQHVNYLGADEQRVAAIQAALNKLQAGRILDRQLRDLNRQAREQLQASKQRLLPLLAGTGFKMHGRAIRRMRKRG